MRALWRAALAITATCASVGLSSVIVGPAGAAATATARPAAYTYSAAGALDGAAAVSNSSAWAVGYAGSGGSAPRILMLHWNGLKWSRVTSPGVLTDVGGLTAITVVSARDAWAVGYTGGLGTGKDHSLIVHWNGSAWSQVTSPRPVIGGNLSAVTATARSGWAVGYVNTNPGAPLCCAGSPLVFRLSGSTWSRLTTRLGDGAFLNGVATTSATTWATGGPLAMITGALAKWNGSAWGWVRSYPVQGAYSPLNGIAAGPGGIMFAVGTDASRSLVPIAMRWTGKAWQKVTVSAPSWSELDAVAFAPGGQAWASGDTGLGTSHTLILRWNGHAWTRVTSAGTSEGLFGLAFSASNYGWAVGHTFSASGSFKAVILHWDGRAWS